MLSAASLTCPAQQPDPHAHEATPSPVDHATHPMDHETHPAGSATNPMDHETHTMGNATNPAETSASQDGRASPPWSQADEIYDPSEMAIARDALLSGHGGLPSWFVLLDRLEFGSADLEDTFNLEGQAWFGGDLNRIRVEVESEHRLSPEELEELEISAMWSRAVSTFWDFQVGLRRESEPHGRYDGMIGIHGLAPYLFEMDFSAFISEDGHGSAEAEVEYDLFLAQRLILQPSLEAAFSFGDAPDRELASGLSNLSVGLRLRYEIVREFAPYVGIEWERFVGETGDLVEARGGESEHVAVVAGFRAWF